MDASDRDGCFSLPFGETTRRQHLASVDHDFSRPIFSWRRFFGQRGADWRCPFLCSGVLLSWQEDPEAFPAGLRRAVVAIVLDVPFVITAMVREGNRVNVIWYRVPRLYFVDGIVVGAPAVALCKASNDAVVLEWAAPVACSFGSLYVLNDAWRKIAKLTCRAAARSDDCSPQSLDEGCSRWDTRDSPPVCRVGG